MVRDELSALFGTRRRGGVSDHGALMVRRAAEPLVSNHRAPRRSRVPCPTARADGGVHPFHQEGGRQHPEEAGEDDIGELDPARLGGDDDVADRHGEEDVDAQEDHQDDGPDETAKR